MDTEVHFFVTKDNTNDSFVFTKSALHLKKNSAAEY